MYIEAWDLQAAVLNAYDWLKGRGDELESRNGKCIERIGATIHLKSVDYPLVLLESRKDFYLHKLYETAWVLAGRDDIGGLTRFLPRAPNFSDDGKTWRGAYGPRLRNWFKHDVEYDSNSYVDQIEECKKLLLADPNTRRALMSIFDPAWDFCETKDVPCNNTVQFLIRDKKLHVVVCQRSSDLLWGFASINVYEWVGFMQYMLVKLNAEFDDDDLVHPGTFTNHFGSLHLYEPHFKKLEAMRKESLLPRPYNPVKDKWRKRMNDFFVGVLQNYTPKAICMMLEADFSDEGLAMETTTDYHSAYADRIIDTAKILWGELGRQPYTHEIFNSLVENDNNE